MSDKNEPSIYSVNLSNNDSEFIAKMITMIVEKDKNFFFLQEIHALIDEYYNTCS